MNEEPTTPPRQALPTLVGMFLLGLGLWFGGMALGGTQEGWDSQAYFVVGVPILMLACWYAGRVGGGHPLAIGTAGVAGQFVALLALSQIGPLFVIGGLLFAAFMLFGSLAAWLGRRSGMA